MKLQFHTKGCCLLQATQVSDFLKAQIGLFILEKGVTKEVCSDLFYADVYYARQHTRQHARQRSM